MQPIGRRELLGMAVASAACSGRAPSSPAAPAEAHGVTAGDSLRFDFDGMSIGVAEYERGPTGCTVFWFPEGARCAHDVRGGSVGVVGEYGFVHAVCFAGGSLLGLEAAAGVTGALHARERDPRRIPLVTGAIIYDLFRGNVLYPDKALGAAALAAAKPGIFPLGRRGAGRNAGCGGGASFAGLQSETTGQGGAFRAVGATKVAVFTVVNALGAIIDRQGRVVRGNRDPKSGERRHYHEVVERAPRTSEEGTRGEHTTLTLVVTNQEVNRLDQLAKQVHSSMARAIQPFHTDLDGDTLIAVSTRELKGRGRLQDVALGVLASEVAWDAVLSSYQV